MARVSLGSKAASNDRADCEMHPRSQIDALLTPAIMLRSLQFVQLVGAESGLLMQAGGSPIQSGVSGTGTGRQTGKREQFTAEELGQFCSECGIPTGVKEGYYYAETKDFACEEHKKPEPFYDMMVYILHEYDGPEEEEDHHEPVPDVHQDRRRRLAQGEQADAEEGDERDHSQKEHESEYQDEEDGVGGAPFFQLIGPQPPVQP